MKEILTIRLENEMDIILAHKRAMKLAELSGCSLVSQTSLATAVSEISRISTEGGKEADVKLFIEPFQNKKYIRAEIKSKVSLSERQQSAIQFAKRLVSNLQTLKGTNESTIVLRFHLNFGGTLTDAKIATIKEYFDQEPPISFYDELRKKNQQLQDLPIRSKKARKSTEHLQIRCL